MKVIYIGYVWPEPRSSAAGLRSINIMSSFLEAGWEVIFCSASKKDERSENLEAKGIQTQTIHLNDSSFDSFISQENPHYVIFDRFVTEEQFGWRVRQHSPKSMRIIDTQDLHFLRKVRERKLKSGLTPSELAQCQFDLITEEALREVAAIYRSDSSLMISDFEKKLLIERFNLPESLLILSRFQYPKTNSFLSFEERAHFVMIGNFLHSPNLDALHWLKTEIWPRIFQELPHAQVHIYGAYPSKELMSLSNANMGFYIKGTADNQYEVLRNYRINLAPLRFGAGIKGKISDGWWTGTPVVSTSLGAEGMSENLPWGGAIADDPSLFAAKAVHLYQSQEEWIRAQSYGQTILQQLYSPMNSKQLLTELEKVYSNLEDHRKSNFIGAMLNHHFHKSTKYFSLWIESKTKLLSRLS